MLKTLARWLAVAIVVLLIAFALFSREGAGWRWLTKGGWHTTARISSLTPQEQAWAHIAWRYFENNTQPQTGLVNGSDKQPRVTLWQMGDTLIALMAGLAVMPSRFALDAAGAVGGPKLLFITMQNVFDKMGSIGPIFGILFYLLVVFAAISSSISLLEVIVAHFVDKARDAGKGDKRKVYTLIAAAAVSLGCILVCADALGNSSFSPADLLGIAEPKAWAADWLDFWDAVSEGVMMPLGALLMTFMVAYEIGTDVVKDEIEQCGNKFTAFKFYNVCVRYVAPLGLLLVLYGQIKQFFF